MGFQPGPMKVSTDDGRSFTLLQPYNYLCRSGELITIPAGATTDGASVPRFFWREFPPFGTYWKAAVLHDYAYRCLSKPKEECDNLLLEAMESLGVDEISAHTIYQAVSLCGGLAFEEDRHMG